MARNMVIGIYGGSGSGKSTVATELLRLLGEDQAVVLDADAYYKDCAHLPPETREQLNFDHPDQLDQELLIQQVRRLKTGQSIEKPCYDFKTHCRALKGMPIDPKKFILLEGLLFLQNHHLRHELDLKIYIHTDEDIRLVRRIQRDHQQRGRTVDSIINQYLSTVKPMHHQFIERTRRYADLTIEFNRFDHAAIKNLARQIKTYRLAPAIRHTGRLTRTLLVRLIIGLRWLYHQTLGQRIGHGS